MYFLKLFDITGQTSEATFADAVVKSWSKRINGPGRLVFTLPIASHHTTSLQKYKRIRLYRNGTPIWYGYLEAHKRTSEAEFTVYCAEMLQLFNKRFTAIDETFTGQGSAEAFGLLSDANADDETGITEGTGGVTTTKDLKAQGRQEILSMWTKLAQAHDAEFQIDEDGAFHFVPTLGTDKTSTIFLRFRRDGNPGNTVEGVEEGEDGEPMANRVIALSTALTSTQNDLTSQGTYGVLVEVKQMNEAQDQGTLDSMAQTYLSQRANPITDFQVMPVMASRQFSTITGQLSVVGLDYNDVEVGDLVTCDFVTETMTIQEARRIAEIVVDVDENAKESVKFTLAKAGVFVTIGLLEGDRGGEVLRRLQLVERLL